MYGSFVFVARMGFTSVFQMNRHRSLGDCHETAYRVFDLCFKLVFFDRGSESIYSLWPLHLQQCLCNKPRNTPVWVSLCPILSYICIISLFKPSLLYVWVSLSAFSRLGLCGIVWRVGIFFTDLFPPLSLSFLALHKHEHYWPYPPSPFLYYTPPSLTIRPFKLGFYVSPPPP